MMAWDPEVVNEARNFVNSEEEVERYIHLLFEGLYGPALVVVEGVMRGAEVN